MIIADFVMDCDYESVFIKVYKADQKNQSSSSFIQLNHSPSA